MGGHEEDATRKTGPGEVFLGERRYRRQPTCIEHAPFKILQVKTCSRKPSARKCYWGTRWNNGTSHFIHNSFTAPHGTAYFHTTAHIMSHTTDLIPYTTSHLTALHTSSLFTPHSTANLIYCTAASHRTICHLGRGPRSSRVSHHYHLAVV